MTRPRIAQADGQIGFYWVTRAGDLTDLPTLMATDDEPERLPATHLEALDDALIDAAGRFGEFLGGGRSPAPGVEQSELRELHRTLDRLVHEYGEALAVAEIPTELRGGQIVGTAALLGIRARMALGAASPTPFAGELDDPSIGVVAGHGRFRWVEPSEPWRGGRWVVEGEDDRSFPLTLSMLLFNSSGVNKDAAVDEHRGALRSVAEAASDPAADPFIVAGAIDWLLHDWLMAHRESSDSAAIEIRPDRRADAELIVAAAAAAAAARIQIDPTIGQVAR
jgi:hypothetical protein